MRPALVRERKSQTVGYGLAHANDNIVSTAKPMSDEGNEGVRSETAREPAPDDDHIEDDETTKLHRVVEVVEFGT